MWIPCRECICWLPCIYSPLRAWTSRDILTDFLNEPAVTIPLSVWVGTVPCLRGPVTEDAFSICIGCAGCFLISSGRPGLPSGGERGAEWFSGWWKTFKHRLKWSSSAITQGVFKARIYHRVCKKGGRGCAAGPVGTRKEKCLLDGVCSERGFFPLPSTASPWSALWSKVCVWLLIASRSARSTVIKPSSRWLAARARQMRGGRSFQTEAAFIDTSQHCACLRLLIGGLIWISLSELIHWQ